MTAVADRQWLRRARPLLGTLVEIGVPTGGDRPQRAVEHAFERIERLQRSLSRFDTHSDVGRFHALRAGESIEVCVDAQTVLRAAAELHAASCGLFDISLSTGPDGWRVVGARLHKLHDRVRLDLGGIAKGHAVDCAVQCLRAEGIDAGWVNAGGDLRGFGAVEVPVHLRDERHGGVRAFATVIDGAFATSFLPGGPDGSDDGRVPHVSVAAPSCLWADALTKVVARSGDARHALLARHAAQAWIH